MKYSSRLYAKAFLEVLKSRAAPVADLPTRLLRLLNKNGDFGRARTVISEIQNMLVKESGGRNVVVRSGQPLSGERRKMIQKNFTENDSVEFRENAELIAGLKVVIDGAWAIDTSLDRKLRSLFRESVNY